MDTHLTPETRHRLEIPGRVEIMAGHGGLPVAKIRAPWSTAEIYLHGAHLTGFQKNGEPPLLFMSRQSWFEPGKAIRGGVPICFPWFGNRDGEPSHGFARTTEWQLVETAAAADGSVTLTLALPQVPGREAWKWLRTQFIVRIADTLTMELATTNDSREENFMVECCLHAYFYVGDISAVSLRGLRGAPFDESAAGAAGTGLVENDPVLRITKEINRVYPDYSGTVEIRDEKLKRTISVQKFNSLSTVVWNPWTTQKLPEDFDPAEHQNMVCVESGNVKQNRLSLTPGKSAGMRVVIGSQTQ